MGFTDSIKHAWTAFRSDDAKPDAYQNFETYGASYGVRPDRTRFTLYGDKSIVSSIYNRLSIDVAAVAMQHVKVDTNGRFIAEMTSGLNYCLTQEANMDQPATAFRQDIAMTLFDKGVAAIVPVDTDIDPENTSAYDIKTMRVGEIVAWYPKHVRVSLYNERKGRREEITLSKSFVAIVENPLYSVMNEPNSTLQRLVRKLSLLDTIDEQSSSGKLDMIIQLPYVIKSEARRSQAEQRRKDIEFQLRGSQYGIAYTDGTEKITQLNRPVENNILKQIEYLTTMLYGQLGLTEEVFNGTASDQVMLNYYNRTINPILTAITESMKRTFLSKTARTQNQTIEVFRDPFKSVAVSNMADIADKFIRNEIFTANEIRAAFGAMPSTDAKADQLRNPNMPQPETVVVQDTPPVEVSPGALPVSELTNPPPTESI